MKDETLREALRTAAKHEPATGDPFARFEAARRRRSFTRGLVVAGIGIFLALSFAFVFPNPLRSGSEAEYNIGGELEPLPNTVRIYEDPVAGFQLRYPARWRVRGRAGDSVVFFVDSADIGRNQRHTDLFAAPHGYTHEIPKTFYIEVTPAMGGNETLAVERGELGRYDEAGAIVTRDQVIPEARGQLRDDQLRMFFGERPLANLKKISYWCENCRLIELTVTLDPARGVPPLLVRVVAPNEDSYNENLFELLPLLDSIERFIVIAG